MHLVVSTDCFSVIFLVSKHWVTLLYNEVNSSNWNRVQGKVTNFQMLTNMSGSRGDRHRYQMYKPQVTYQYHWQGNTFFGSKVVWLDYYEGNETGSSNTLYVRGMQLKRAYDSNVDIDIYINPRNPKESIIYRDSAWSVYVIGFFSSLLSGLPFFGLVYFAFRKTWYFIR